MLLATFKHISSKNADYSAAEAYLTFEHDEFTMKPTLDENSRLIPRQDYRISTLNCGDEDFAIACLRANLRYGKNQKREDVKSHHYIISFDPKDVSNHGLNVDLAQSMGEKFCKEHFPGHQAIVCTHPDGHNGSGKSTLAKTFNAVLLPSGGKVYVEGMDTMDESLLLEIRRRVGMVFQNPDNQIVANVVEEDVAFAPENLGVPSDEIRKRVDDALEAVGMTQFVKHAPHLLSGGQKQRIAIAGVLAMKPECIVLDEATAMLDPIGRREVLAAVEKLNREQGITVVLITHHMNEAEHADRVIVMNDGLVVMDGKPREVFTRKKELEDIGLAVPDTVSLLFSLREAGMDIPVDAITVEECADVIAKNFT